MGERVPFSTTIDSDLYRRVRGFAARERLGIAFLFEEAIRLVLAERESR